jgi:hypothetical protein
MSISGHKDAAEVQTYVNAANRKKMRRRQWRCSTALNREQPTANPNDAGWQFRKKSKKNKARFWKWRSLGESNPCFSLERANGPPTQLRS